jgi:hypothetical protein
MLFTSHIPPSARAAVQKPNTQSVTRIKVLRILYSSKLSAKSSNKKAVGKLPTA